MPSTRRPEGNLAPPTPRAGCVPQGRHAGGAGSGTRHAARGAAGLPVAVDRGGRPDSAEAGPPRAACTDPPACAGRSPRLDSEPKRGNTTETRLGLSELLAGTRVRGAQPDPQPRVGVRSLHYPAAPWQGQRRGPWTPTPPMDAKTAPTGSLQNRKERGFAQRPQPSSSSSSRTQNKTRCWSRPRRPVSRIEHFHATLDTASSSRRCRNGWTRTGSRRRPRTTCPQGNPTFAPQRAPWPRCRDAMRDNAPVARAINTARARTCFDPSIRLPDTLGSPDPLQAHFWIGKSDRGCRRGSGPPRRHRRR